MPNPFQKVYDGVYDLLFAGVDNPLAGIIQPANYVGFDSNNSNPVKSSVAGADMPQVMLVDEGGNTNLHSNSSGSQYVQNLSLYASSGDLRYSIISNINWAILCNLGKWRTLLSGITWNGESIVKDIALIPIIMGADATINVNQPTTIKGWTSIWRLQITLRISNVNLVYTES